MISKKFVQSFCGDLFYFQFTLLGPITLSAIGKGGWKKFSIPHAYAGTIDCLYHKIRLLFSRLSKRQLSS